MFRRSQAYENAPVEEARSRSRGSPAKSTCAIGAPPAPPRSTVHELAPGRARPKCPAASPRLGPRTPSGSGRATLSSNRLSRASLPSVPADRLPRPGGCRRTAAGQEPHRATPMPPRARLPTPVTAVPWPWREQHVGKRVASRLDLIRPAPRSGACRWDLLRTRGRGALRAAVFGHLQSKKAIWRPRAPSRFDSRALPRRIPLQRSPSASTSRRRRERFRFGPRPPST